MQAFDQEKKEDLRIKESKNTRSIKKKRKKTISRPRYRPRKKNKF